MDVLLQLRTSEVNKDLKKIYSSLYRNSDLNAGQRCFTPLETRFKISTNPQAQNLSAESTPEPFNGHSHLFGFFLIWAGGVHKTVLV